jgi:hypothetical protein
VIAATNGHTVLTLTRGSWSTGGCATTYTYYLYRDGVQFATGDMTSVTQITYTLTASDIAHTVTGKVQACAVGGDCSGTASATGSTTVRAITYSVWINGVNENINWQVQSPNEISGIVEAQPRNGICQTFNTAFGSFNAGFATGTSSTVSLNSGMTNYGTNLNGGENGSNSAYPDAVVNPHNATNWQSTMTTSGVSCPDSAFPGIGEYLYPSSGYAPVNLTGTITRYEAGLTGSPNPEIQLTQYWLAGNTDCPTDPTDGGCDWIEIGEMVGTTADCGAPINNGDVYFYVEELKNREPSSASDGGSFGGNGSCVTTWNGSMAHWHQNDGTREFYIFGPATSYGTTNTMQLKYVSG